MEMTQELKPPYVRFERRAVEDRSKSMAAGRYGYRDVDIACITSPGQKDIVDRPVQEWLDYLAKQALDGRVPQLWVDHYNRAYSAWQQSQEVPENGTPIRGWTVLSPAAQETVLAANIRTVEDLATANVQALSAIGMGGQTLKSKAEAWLKASKDTGTIAERLASLERDNADLKRQNEELLAKIKKSPAI